MEGHWKFLGGGGGGLKSQNVRSKAKLEFPGGGTGNKKPSVGGVWIFSGIAQFVYPRSIKELSRNSFKGELVGEKVELDFGNVGFCGGRKTSITGEKPRGGGGGVGGTSM